jgi:hypothetical protein
MKASQSTARPNSRRGTDAASVQNDAPECHHPWDATPPRTAPPRLPEGSRRAGRGVWFLRVAGRGLFGAQSPRLSGVEPARTEETVTLNLPPRPELLNPSGPSQLVYLAQHRAHFLFVA